MGVYSHHGIAYIQMLAASKDEQNLSNNTFLLDLVPV